MCTKIISARRVRSLTRPLEELKELLCCSHCPICSYKFTKVIYKIITGRRLSRWRWEVALSFCPRRFELGPRRPPWAPQPWSEPSWRRSTWCIGQEFRISSFRCQSRPDFPVHILPSKVWRSLKRFLVELVHEWGYCKESVLYQTESSNWHF